MTDKRSSNGTMVYLQDPIPLSYSNQLKFRMGRTTLSLQAKRGWTTTLRTALGVGSVIDEEGLPSAEDLHNVLTECRNNSMSKRETDAEANNFMLIRQYTTRTNNDNSIDPHEAEHYMEGMRESRAGGHAGDVHSEDGGIDLLGREGLSPNHRTRSAEEEEVLLNRMRATFVEDEDLDFNRAIQESLLATHVEGSRYQSEDDNATIFEHQASTDALPKANSDPSENSKRTTATFKSPRKESPSEVVMLGEEVSEEFSVLMR